LRLDEWERYYGRHQVPVREALQPDFKWFVPWALGKVVKFESPVSFKNPPGAVTYVNLPEEIQVQIQARLTIGEPAQKRSTKPMTLEEAVNRYPRFTRVRQFKL